jgi:hypothetical protein
VCVCVCVCVCVFVCDFHCITVSQGNLHYDLPKVVVDQKLGKLQSN